MIALPSCSRDSTGQLRERVLYMNASALWLRDRVNVLGLAMYNVHTYANIYAFIE